MTNYVDLSIKSIRDFLKNTGTAKSRLALMANVPEGCTRNVESNDWNPTTETLRKLESAIPKTKVKKLPTN